MSNDISGFGAKVLIIANNTFPQGLEITQFADDSDPFDVPAVQIADSAMGLNGDKVNWIVANPLPTTMNVIPGSDDDKNLAILFEANRAGRNKSSAKDVITGVISYPDGQVVTFTGGNCQEFVVARGISSDSRLKTRPYTIVYENVVSFG